MEGSCRCAISGASRCSAGIRACWPPSTGGPYMYGYVQCVWIYLLYRVCYNAYVHMYGYRRRAVSLKPFLPLTPPPGTRPRGAHVTPDQPGGAGSGRSSVQYFPVPLEQTDHNNALRDCATNTTASTHCTMVSTPASTGHDRSSREPLSYYIVHAAS